MDGSCYVKEKNLSSDGGAPVVGVYVKVSSGNGSVSDGL